MIKFSTFSQGNEKRYIMPLAGNKSEKITVENNQLSVHILLWPVTFEPNDEKNI
jgi:hypothetical protein